MQDKTPKFSLSIYFTHNVWEFLHLEQKSVEIDSKPNWITLQNTNMSYFYLYPLSLIQVTQNM